MKLITDTGSLITEERAKELDLTLLPLQVTVAGKSYRDYLEISEADFIQLIKTDYPSSSQPAIGEILDAYEDQKETLHIAMTSGLSGAYSSAHGLIQSENIKHVTLFNSKTLAGTQQYLVELAVQLNKEGKSVEEIIERMEYCHSDCQSFLIPNDFDYLKRGGRLSPVGATLGSLIRIKPIVTQVEGGETLEKFGFKRTWKSAIREIVKHMAKNGVCDKHKIYILHAENEESAELAKSIVEERIENADIKILTLTPAMVTQGGPNLVAMQYIRKDPQINFI